MTAPRIDRANAQIDKKQEARPYADFSRCTLIYANGTEYRRFTTRLISSRGLPGFLSVITVGEIAKGVAVRERTDPVAAAALGRWLDGLRQLYADRILAVDDVVAAAWGHLMARRSFAVPDGLIAATARVHNLTLVTRNVADFAATGVAVAA